MRFDSYLLTESRGKRLTKDETLKLLKKNCKRALSAFKRGDRIYRGNHSADDYLFYDSKTADLPRKSRNTKNYYTLIIDNSAAWKKFPQRSESLICTTNKTHSGNFGINAYSVFPYDGATIGVVPARDFWWGFRETTDLYLSEWNTSLRELFEEMDIPLNDKSYQGIIKAFNRFDSFVKEYTDDEWTNLLINANITWLEDYHKYNDLLKLIDDKFHPYTNGFKLIKAGYPIGCDDCEVWTSDKCILVRNTPYMVNQPIESVIEELGYGK